MDARFTRPVLMPWAVKDAARTAVPFLAAHEPFAAGGKMVDPLALIAMRRERVNPALHYMFCDGKTDPDLVRQLFGDNADRLNVDAQTRATFDPADWVGVVACVV